MKKTFDNKYLWFGLFILMGVLIGWFVKPSGKSVSDATPEHLEQDAETDEIWTCAMHPQIRRNEPGQCPICGMDLIPLGSEGDSEGMPGTIAMSPTAMQLADIETMVVGNEQPVMEVRLSGKVQADERKVFSQVSHLPGRIEQLTINFTGEEVRKGQTVALIYSPDLATAQDELFEAYKMRENQPALYQAARGKLLNWKLTEKQIDEIMLNGKPEEQFPVVADVSGIVMNKRVDLGDYIQKGQSLFEVADLSGVWILFDVYESDMPWIRKGAQVEFTVQSIPGETFKGNISFMDPVINPKTRVAKARVEMNNSGHRFKPEMFVTGIIKSSMANKKGELVVPKSAVMWTGERSVVYVRDTSANGTRFQMREIVLGPALGNSFMVKSGLQKGEEIAVNGTFSIDAAAQLAGKPSMMNPKGSVVSTGHNHEAEPMNSPTTDTGTHSISKKAKEALIPLFNEYLLLKDALVADDFEKSKQTISSMLIILDGVNMNDFTGNSHKEWMKHYGTLKTFLTSMAGAEDKETIRKAFKPFSEDLIQLAEAFGPFDEVLYVQHCPMADNNTGADWISSKKEIKNPYFGSAMLTCGEIIQVIK